MIQMSSNTFNEAFGLPEEEPKKQLQIFQPPQECPEEDFKYARQNIYDTMEISQRALEDLAKLAKSAQSARVYEVLANMVKTSLEASKDLLELQKKRRDLQKEGSPSIPNEPQIVNNNLFMTTAQLQEHIENLKKNDTNPE